MINETILFTIDPYYYGNLKTKSLNKNPDQEDLKPLDCRIGL